MNRVDIRDYPPFRQHFMSREADGFLDCVCLTCGWSRRLVADNQGAAGPLHVVIHARQCCARLTEAGLKADEVSFEESLISEG